MASKYHSRKITKDGIIFDSVKEYRRFCELSLLERAGAIADLKRQVKFELIPSQRVDGKVVERPCTYVADFVYLEKGKDGIFRLVVEDVKSEATKTREYIIKRKLMLWRCGIRIREV